MVHFKTAAQDAAVAPGYQPNGEGQFSRRVARGGERPMSVNDSPRADAPRPHVYLLHHQLVARTNRNLEKLRSKLATETDPARREKLARDAEIAARFLRRLLAERMKAKRHAL